MIKAKMYFLNTEEGGRSTPIIITSNGDYTFWANSIKFASGSWSIGLHFGQEMQVLPGTTHVVEVRFIAQEACKYFKSDDELLFCEGAKVIARGKIL